MDQRVFLNQVLNTTSEDAGIVDIFETTGRMVQTDQPTYSHKTNDYIFRAGTISAVDATLNGDTDENLQITLTTDEELPIVGEIAMLQNKQQGRVISVNTSTRVVVIEPDSADAADALGGVSPAPASGQKVTFISGAYGEGSDDPESKRPSFKDSKNQIQIFKTAREITDLQKVSTIEFPYNGKNFILYKMQHDALLEHRAKIAFQFLVGKKATTTDADGKTVYRTQGLRQYILNGDGEVMTTGGVNSPLAGTIALTDFKTMSRSLDKRGAGKEYWLWSGGDIDADMDDVFMANNVFANGGIDFNSWGSTNPKEKAIELGVRSFTLYGRTYHKKKIAAYDHPEVFAPSAGFNFGSEAYLIPAGKTKVDASGNMVDSIRVRYMSNDGSDFGKWNEVLTGKLAPTPTNTKSVLHVSYQSIMGLEVLGVRQFAAFSKA